MPEKEKPVKNTEVRKLLTVIISAVLSACLLAWGMTIYYSPSGQYHLEQVLVSADNVKKLRYEDKSLMTGTMTKYSFDRYEFSFYDPTEEGWKSSTIDSGQYERFYRIVNGDLSIKEVSEEEINLFQKGNPATLAIVVKSIGASKETEQSFQEVQFANTGDHYRVMLRQENNSTTWIYFSHQGIYREVLGMFQE